MENQTPTPQTTQAPAQVAPAPEVKGLETWTPEQLKEAYAKSPELFEKAGIVQPKKVEAKTEAQKPADGAAKPGEFKLKLRDGVPVEDEAMKKFTEIMSDDKLSSVEKAQKLYDLQADTYETHVKRAKQADADFEKALRADPEFGKDYEASMAIAQQGLQKFDKSGALQKVLVDRGLSKDPAIVRYFHEIGKAASEARTPNSPTPPVIEAKTEEDFQRLRYNNSPEMFGDTPKEQRQ